MADPKKLTEEEWSEKLSPESFRVLRQKGTEISHSGKYNEHFATGIYNCAGCNTPLFDSDQKFNAGCGWPSFDGELTEAGIEQKTDHTHGMVRTEILCGNCGGHLGHIFNDGPSETGLRYCVNSVSLSFEKKGEGVKG